MDKGQARRIVEGDLKAYDHLGELVDIPTWGGKELAGGDSKLLKKLGGNIANTHYHHSYSGGNSAPTRGNVGGYAFNSRARFARCANSSATKKGLPSPTYAKGGALF